MKVVRHSIGAILLTLLVASTAMALTVYTYADIEIKNQTSETIKIKLDIDDGSGGGSATIPAGGKMLFDTKETAWWMKDKTHHNKLYVTYDGKEAITLDIRTENEAGFTGDAITGNISIETVSNPLNCSVSATHKVNVIPLPGSTLPPNMQTSDIVITLESCQ